MTWQAEYSRFREGFREALDPRLYPIEYLDDLVSMGQALLWFSDNSAIAAEIKEYPTGAKDIHGLCMAGDVEEAISLLIPQAEAWGKSNGCIGALIQSRPAWQRKLKSHGYELHQVAVRKEL